MNSASKKVVGQLTLKNADTFSPLGHTIEFTRGIKPLNMDPMETRAQRYLDDKIYCRAELTGDGTHMGDIFISEGEGPGVHVPFKKARDAAFFVKASDRSVGGKFSFSF